MSIFYLIVACASVAYGQDDSACLVQRHGTLKQNETQSRNPFSSHQQKCIDDYVLDVKTVVPHYDLSDRKFGGTSPPFPADGTPPILGPGFGTTATRSLAELGRQLGLQVHHWITGLARKYPVQKITELAKERSCSERGKLNDVNFLKIMLDFEPTKGGRTGRMMFLDTPIGELFLDWYAASPNSKVILTVRDPTEWATTRSETHGISFLPYESPCGGHFTDLPVEDLAKLMEFHHTLVRCMVPSDKFLEINIFNGKNTAKVNPFLGFPHDHRPFPQTSTSSRK